MARKLELKTVPLSGAAPNGAAPLMFSYAESMVAMLRFSERQGLSYEEVVKSCEVLGPLQAAIEAQVEEITLTDSQWRTLQERLMQFRFGIADPAIVDLGRMILDAPEITS